MKNTMKRMVVSGLATAMILGMGVTAFADDNHKTVPAGVDPVEWYNNNIKTIDDMEQYFGGMFHCQKDDANPIEFRGGSVSSDTKNKINAFKKKWNVEYFNRVNGKPDENDFVAALATLDKAFELYGSDAIGALTKYHPMHINLSSRKNDIAELDSNPETYGRRASYFDAQEYRFMRYYDDFRHINAVLSLIDDTEFTLDSAVDGLSLAMAQYIMTDNGTMTLTGYTCPDWMIRDDDGVLLKGHYKAYSLIPYYLGKELSNALQGINKPAYGTQNYLRAQWLYDMSVHTFGSNSNIAVALAKHLGK